ncbi:uncharacterized protein LOC141685128 [Apium graveolens]|uniref:uncharacterized protein LOC141685128 n=1 Tax=Apium graveolens TaxID=4045 RepID=UPI003D7BD5D5
MKLLEKQEEYWKQRAKQFWLREGDQNTRFFHKYASTRRKNNQVQRLKDENGVWRENVEDIQNIITRYFSQLFQVSTKDGKLSEREKVNQITDEDNAALLEEVSDMEVKMEVFSMHPDKSPGVDGLNPAFFQIFWNVVGQDVIQFYRNYMRIGELLRGVNRTLM